MKRIIIAASAFVSCALLTTSCFFSNTPVLIAKGDMVQKTYDIPEYNAITCSIPADITYVMTDSCSLVISAPENVSSLINAKVDEDGRLVIKVDSVKLHLGHLKVEIKTCSPSLAALTLNGAADVNIPFGITAKDFSATMNGAADMNINGLKAENVTLKVNGAADLSMSGLDCQNITIGINGAGDMVVSGKAEHASVEINGAGDIDATSLSCTDFASSVHGAGSIRRQ